MEHPDSVEKRDVETLDDIADIVSRFYADIESDPTIGRFFVGLDWSAHLPRMISFWSAIAFQTGTYHGRPLELHAALPGLDSPHFATWLARWRETLDTWYSGDRADMMKARAEQIGGVFMVKLGIYPTT